MIYANQKGWDWKAWTKSISSFIPNILATRFLFVCFVSWFHHLSVNLLLKILWSDPNCTSFVYKQKWLIEEESIVLPYPIAIIVYVERCNLDLGTAMLFIHFQSFKISPLAWTALHIGYAIRLSDNGIYANFVNLEQLSSQLHTKKTDLSFLPLLTFSALANAFFFLKFRKKRIFELDCPSIMVWAA